MPRRETVLVVDDQPDFARGLARLIGSRRENLDVLLAGDGQEALDLLDKAQPSILFTDLRMPGMSGQELLERALDRAPSLTAVMLTAHGDVGSAVAALKAGAYDFLVKPVEPETLFLTLDKALERARLLSENRRLRESVAEVETWRELIGESPSVLRLKETIAAVARSDYTVLIQGESGTGKEVVARAVHAMSQRSDGPMICVNCPAIPEQLLESELFGHVKGAFTGAEKASKGLFLAAEAGTILLDEIGDIPMNVQTKLLRVLQEREVRPVGGSETVAVDVRIIASTNQHLEEKIKDRSFREDLFYRLNVLTVATPALRERREDIPLLAAHFLRRTCKEMNLPEKELTPDALGYLAGREWPGNVRELQNFVRRLVVFAQGRVIDAHSALAADGGPLGVTQAASCALGSYQDAKNQALEAFTRSYVEQLLSRTRGNVSEAARVSGLERASLQKILKRLAIDTQDYKN
ncbi:Transcriptional regulatory protein GlrR [Fundidesulfovibrio magnetotacticus]|uniref:Transcriptional regulatory protein GlrR n=1 Tax=Fundidesulfovibrio magnetotacticus TaxID=2730080 RepID=A0A6V8LRF1_9BACT|nr:sigma-54 dependent transcriptional regulator [Fundidesulfovibrio magnetotacticus]GFK93131.1 Transcriptional regulatory protein GlrR [Fundidesulfovibrio magnetotacticus]